MEHGDVDGGGPPDLDGSAIAVLDYKSWAVASDGSIPPHILSRSPVTGLPSNGFILALMSALGGVLPYCVHAAGPRSDRLRTRTKRLSMRSCSRWHLAPKRRAEAMN